MTDDEAVELMAKAVFEKAWAGETWQNVKGDRRAVYLEEASRHFTALRFAGWQVLPAGFVVVPEKPPIGMWGNDLVRNLMRWCEGSSPTPRKLIDLLKFSGIEQPEWLSQEPEMAALDHAVSKGTRAALIYRAMTSAKGE